MGWIISNPPEFGGFKGVEFDTFNCGEIAIISRRLHQQCAKNAQAQFVRKVYKLIEIDRFNSIKIISPLS